MCMKNKKGRAGLLFSGDYLSSKIALALKTDLDRIEGKLCGQQLEAFRFFKERQLNDFDKKYVNTTNVKKLHDACIIKFLNINNHMKNLCPASVLFKTDFRLKRIIKIARNLISNILHRDSDLSFYDEWYLNCKHGPGVTIGTKFADSSIESKFTTPISVTPSCRMVFSDYLRYNKKLAILLSDQKADIDAVSSIEYIKYFEVPGSRASTVEKDKANRRFIAIEPTCNMFMQQGLMVYFYERMAEYGLSLSELPEKHKVLARESSISGLNATIDFSSASDTVSIDLLRLLMPYYIFDSLMQVRSPYVSIDGFHHKLYMYATMGNATTFPIETLIFYSLAVACVAYNDPKLNPHSLLAEFRHQNKVSVFGDDCILPASDAPLFVKVCEQLGFLVNKEKSFVDGPFRESCGGDYYHGFDVRPYYIKQPVSERLSSLVPFLSIICNRLLLTYKKWVKDEDFYMSTNIAIEVKAILNEYKQVPFMVPDFYPEDSGFRIKDDLDRYFFLSIVPELCEFHVSQAKDQFGLIKFKYKRFTYRSKRKTNVQLRYLFELIRLQKRQNKQDCNMSYNDYFQIIRNIEQLENPIYTSRKILGGYVEAFGYTAHWL